MQKAILRAFILGAAMTCAAAPVMAQGFGGSFDSTPSQAPAQTTTQPVTRSGGGFGGSFGDSGSETAQPGAQVTPGPTEDGSRFDGGSFDTVQPGSGTIPTEPVTPEQTAPAITIDPQIFAFEARDFGVPPTNQLRNGQLHAATPTAIPGGAVVATQDLANALNSGMQVVLIDVLGGQYTLPNAYSAPGLSQPGSFRDRAQQQAAQWLSQITGGNPDTPIVVFCSDPQCWLSYNASLRTINAGFRAVYWYRGGIQAWQMAGLPLQPGAY